MVSELGVVSPDQADRSYVELSATWEPLRHLPT